MSFICGALIALVASGATSVTSFAQTPPDGGVASAAVDARPLATLDLFSAGAKSTGLPTTLWKGASADLAHRVFLGLGAQPIEPGLALLARDMLETAASAPDTAGADAELAGDRVLSLIRLGDLDAARAILSRTPGVAAKARLSQAAADLALWTGDAERACGVAEALSEGRDTRYWLELRAFCLIRAGKPDQAQLALDFAAQSGGRNRQLQHMLAVSQGLKSDAQDPGQASNALAFMLSRLSKADLSGAIPSAPTPALIALSTDEAQLPEIRRRAAVNLLASGATAPEAIRSALRTAVAPPKKTAAPPSAGRHKSRHADAPVSEDAADSLARDYQSATGAATNAERTGALLRLFRAVHGAAFRNLCDVAAPELALITPEGLSSPDRALLAMAASLVDAPSATALRDGLSATDGVTEVDLLLVDAVHELGAMEPKPSRVTGLLVKAGQRAQGPEQAKAQSAAVLLAALNGPGGKSQSDRAAFTAFRTGSIANVAAILSAQNAAEAGAAGEAGLVALDASLEKGLTHADRALFVRALRRAGLERAARSIALDGLLALTAR